ncbi:MAG: hypothetical protein RLZZ196_519 [Bacteroidota bacterium]|jgi:hypothetical protein
MYDIFFIGNNDNDFNQLKSRFPTAKRIVDADLFQALQTASKKSFTKMFWVVWDNLIISKDFNFNYKVPVWDLEYNHIFKNGNYYDGICLFPKNLKISKREADYRFFVNKKEIDVVASTPKPYQKFYISDYDQYITALETSETDMFWAVWPNIEVIDESVFDITFSFHNTYDRQENHVWKNLCNDAESYISGLTLFSKSKTVSKREVNYRMLINRKEYDAVASRFRYPRYCINSYNEYLEIHKTEKQPLFWCTWPEIEILDDKIFDFYFDPLDGTYNYDREENHVYQNKDISEIKYNGLMLMSTLKPPVSKKEIEFRYLINKKEHEILASKLKPYDVVFISYNEPNADLNFKNLLKKCPRAKRVHGVRGIHQAHIAAAKLATTPMFWVVDGDAKIVEDFDFDLLLPQYDRDIVHVWKSQNPVNGLVYGNGGVKLLPTVLTLNVDVTSPDMTTSISPRFRAIDKISNLNNFNTDPFTTWRSAFRECAKLSSKTISGQIDTETEERLNIWCKVSIGKYGEYAVAGALAGRKYGQENAGNKPALSKINNYSWLEAEFTRSQTHQPLEIFQQ